MANSATLPLYVSTEMGTVSCLLKASIIGTILLISSSSLTGAWPGLVDSPPTSMMSAPSSTIFFARFMAASISLNLPPSEKESGVIFKIPIM